MVKQAVVIVMILIVLFASRQALMDLEMGGQNLSHRYYVLQAYEETGAENVVTAILLDYRFFDSVFEAALLLIASAGILFLIRNTHSR